MADEKHEKKKEKKQKEKKQKDNQKENQKEDKSKEKNETSANKLIPTFLKVDEAGNINYADAEKEYDITPVELDDGNIKSCGLKNLDKVINPLIERKILCGAKNLAKLKDNKKLFLLYELVFNEHTQLCTSDIFLLNVIKNIMVENPETNLIIQLADDELYYQGKYNFTQVSRYALEKLENVLKLLLSNIENPKIHVFSTTTFHIKDNDFENLVSDLMMKISFERLTTLFHITEDDPVSSLNYPCYLAMSANASIYTKYIPELTKEYTCLIINSIFNMYRYQLCYDAAKLYDFNEPILLATKIISPLTGCNGYECFYNNDDSVTLLTSDDEKVLRKKIMKHSVSGSRGGGSLEEHKKLGGDVIKDISCQYLAFVEKDYEKYKEYIEKFGKGEIACGEIKDIMFKSLNELFKVVRDAKEVDTQKYFFVK